MLADSKSYHEPAWLPGCMSYLQDNGLYLLHLERTQSVGVPLGDYRLLTVVGFACSMPLAPQTVLTHGLGQPLAVPIC